MTGREYEISELNRIYGSGESEFVMVYGRRRVGKTFLIREFFKNDFVFYCTGIADGTKEEELINFASEIRKCDENLCHSVPKTWFEAFEMMYGLVEKSHKKRKVIFLDEVPWMYTQKSDFIKALEHLWNARLSVRKDVILVVCGSAASWMVKKIVNSKGGLHNRITLKLKLGQFTLRETRAYLESLGISWDNRTIAECYMALGGVPYYLKLLDRSISLAQNMDRLFFRETALLDREFDNLYASLFRDSRDYIKIVEVLSKKKSGYTRDEIIRHGHFNNGGGITDKIEDLVQCDFIRKYKAIGEVKHTYQLCDFFTLFYFQFIKKGHTYDTETWMHLSGKPVMNTWKGLAFERLCISHLPQIKQVLGISGISTNSYSYYSENVQVDLLIERGDKVIDICEIKYYDGPFAISSEYALKLKTKLETVKSAVRKRFTYFIVMITAEGLLRNKHSAALVQKEILLDSLF